MSKYFNWHLFPNKSQSPSSDERSVDHEQKQDNVRSASNILKRISNLLVLKNDSNLQSYEETNLKQYWMPDSTSKECYECNVKFTTFRRKHHCRLCGQIFCFYCCYHEIPGKVFGCIGLLKVCSYCCRVILSYLQSPNINSNLTPDLKSLQEDLLSKFENFNSTSEQSQAQSILSADSFSIDEINETSDDAFPSRRSTLCNEKVITLDLTEATLKNLFDEICNPFSGLTFHLQRYQSQTFVGCFLGSELVDWLLIRSKVQSRSDAVKIGEALFKMKLIDNVSDQKVFSDSCAIFRPRITTKNVSKSSECDDLKNDEPSWTLEIPNDCNISDSDLELPNMSQLLTSANDYKYKPVLDNENLPEFNSLDLFLVDGIDNMENYNAKIDLMTLSQLYLKHESTLLKQEIIDRNLSMDWVDILLPATEKIIERFQLNKYSNPTYFDIRPYIQFKKLFSADKNDCEIFNGFACSKNIPNSKMANYIENPKILLLECPLVFERNEPKFISLDTVKLQEEMYLKQICDKILSVEPTLVLVNKTVTLYVQDVLRSKEITIVGNIKMSVLNRLSQSMKCPILNSIDTVFSKPRLGICKKFYTKTLFFDKENCRQKTLMFFEGLPIPNLGCTVFLKGSSYYELKKVKEVAAFFLFAAYNNVLEKSFNREILAKPVSTFDNHDKKNDMMAVNEFEAILVNRILTTSPSVRFSLPYFESEKGKKCKLRSFFPNNLYYSKFFDDTVCSSNNKENQSVNFPIKKCLQNTLKPTNDFIVSKLIGNVNDEYYQTKIALFRAKGCQYENIKSDQNEEKDTKTKKSKLTEEYFDVFDSKNHQKLDVLFCCYCLRATSSLGFCINPWIVQMEFYGQTDIPLGLFLEKYCFRKDYNCSTKSCQLSMIYHIRRFVHSNGCVSVSLSQIDGKFDQIIDDNVIAMWNWCKICKILSPIVPMSDMTWFLSLAKFLEMKFYAHSFFKRGSNSCEHLLHVDHYQYFRLKNVVACFKYDRINLLEICLPEKLIHINLDFNKREMEMIDEVKALSLNGHEIYSLVLEKLVSIVIDNDSLTNLKIHLQKDQNNFRNMIEEAHFNLTTPFDKNEHEQIFLKFRSMENALSKIKKAILNSVDAWNSRLSDCEKKRKENTSNLESNLFSDVNIELKDSSDLEIDTLNKKVQDEECSDSLSKKEPDKNRVKTIFSQFLTSNQNATIIQSPFSLQEHHMLPAGQYFCLSVYESEPSSIVAYALNSIEYKKSFNEICKQKLPLNPAVSDNNNENVDVKKEKLPHIEVQFGNQNCNFFCRIYFAEKFANLRHTVMSFSEEMFIMSISRSISWKARGGKSGCNFAKTKDERFIIKDLPRTELELFLKSAEKYFDYFDRKYHEQNAIPTILAKIVGVYHVIYQNLVTNSSFRTTFFIMENLFYNQNVSQKFDLKGSVRNRLINPHDQDGEIVFLDENFIKMSCESPLYVYPHSKEILATAIENDTKFLMELSVIDYSLLVGLDSAKNELIIGIIDYIRTFTWSKKLENIVKKSGILGGQGRAPTIVSPEEYRERFLKAMHLYFLEVPDHWTGLRK